MEVVGDGVLFDIIVPIPAKNYTGSTLATAIQGSLNALSFNGNSNLFTLTYDQELNTMKMEISNDYSFGVLIAYEIKHKKGGTWKGPDYDTNKPNDMNTQVLKQYESSFSTKTSQGHDKDKPFVSPSIDLQPIKNIYLSSPNLGSYTTIGPRGERTILKKIPVTAGFNFVIFDNTIIKEEFLDVSKQTLSTLHILIHDSYGNLIPLHGSDWSFSLCFAYSG